VVIDAGHGGKDPGSQGPTGLQEKEVALDVARRLQELFRRDPRTQDIKVVMTRDEDVFIPLRDRYEIANREKGDLFISIHANAWDDPSVNGFMTFFLDEAKNDEARQIATFENSVLRYEENSRALQIDVTEPILRGILGELISTKYLEESQVFAGLIQDELRGRIRHQVRDRRIDQGPFLVLNGASMPSVLVEIAFISNRAEENFLRQNSFKNKVAEALHAAVISYRERVEVGRR
jgi:N-acetylmuramoyl-L-alanine amidase